MFPHQLPTEISTTSGEIDDERKKLGRKVRTAESYEGKEELI